jgi:hypothetical protein
MSLHHFPRCDTRYELVVSVYDGGEAFRCAYDWNITVYAHIHRLGNTHESVSCSVWSLPLEVIPDHT